jgi:hypothetical protein
VNVNIIWMNDTLRSKHWHSLPLNTGTSLSGYRLVFYKFKLVPLIANVSKRLKCYIPTIVLPGPVGRYLHFDRNKNTILFRLGLLFFLGQPWRSWWAMPYMPEGFGFGSRWCHNWHNPSGRTIALGLTYLLT